MARNDPDKKKRKKATPRPPRPTLAPWDRRYVDRLTTAAADRTRAPRSPLNDALPSGGVLKPFVTGTRSTPPTTPRDVARTGARVAKAMAPYAIPVYGNLKGTYEDIKDATEGSFLPAAVSATLSLIGLNKASKAGRRALAEVDAVKKAASIESLRGGQRFAIFTAENPGGASLSVAENAKRNKALKAELRRRGYRPLAGPGRYQDYTTGEVLTENSFFVPNIPEREAKQLAKRFGQNGVVTQSGYHDMVAGKLYPTQSIDEATGLPYTEINGNRIAINTAEEPVDATITAPPEREVFTPPPRRKGVRGLLDTISELPVGLSTEDLGAGREKPFYSRLERRLDAAKQEKMSAAEWRKWLSTDVSKTERAERGVDALLTDYETAGQPLTRAQIREVLDEFPFEIEQRRLEGSEGYDDIWDNPEFVEARDRAYSEAYDDAVVDAREELLSDTHSRLVDELDDADDAMNDWRSEAKAVLRKARDADPDAVPELAEDGALSELDNDELAEILTRLSDDHESVFVTDVDRLARDYEDVRGRLESAQFDEDDIAEYYEGDLDEDAQRQAERQMEDWDFDYDEDDFQSPYATHYPTYTFREDADGDYAEVLSYAPTRYAEHADKFSPEVQAAHDAFIETRAPVDETVKKLIQGGLPPNAPEVRHLRTLERLRPSSAFIAPHFASDRVNLDRNLAAHRRMSRGYVQPDETGRHAPYEISIAEEYQSDWSQAARESGVLNPALLARRQALSEEGDTAFDTIAGTKEVARDRLVKVLDSYTPSNKTTQGFTLGPFNVVKDIVETYGQPRHRFTMYHQGVPIKEHIYGRTEYADSADEVSELFKRALRSDLVGAMEGHRLSTYPALPAELREVVDPAAATIMPLVARKKEINKELSKLAGATDYAPPLPGTEDWLLTLIKQHLEEAARSGADFIGWAPGEEHIRRYKAHLQKAADAVAYDPVEGAFYAKLPGSKDWTHVPREGGKKTDEAHLERLVGKDAARQLLAQPLVAENGTLMHTVTSGDIAYGGEGARAFYDEITPNLWRKYLRKLVPGTNIEPELMNTTEGFQVMGFRLPAAVREHVMRYGQPLLATAPFGLAMQQQMPFRPEDETQTPAPEVPGVGVASKLGIPLGGLAPASRLRGY